MGLCIDRCVCFDQPFSRLVTIARDRGATSLEALQAHVTFGEKCRLCHPYVRRALQTGEVVFRELLPPEPPPRR